MGKKLSSKDGHGHGTANGTSGRPAPQPTKRASMKAAQAKIPDKN